MILNKLGMYAQGYTEDFVILISGKHLGTCLDFMQSGLTIVEGWYKKEGLSFNPLKTVMAPTPNIGLWNVLKDQSSLTGGFKVPREFKYLRIKLDDRLKKIAL